MKGHNYDRGTGLLCHKCKKIHSHKSGKNSPMYGVRLFGKLNPFYGKHHSKKTRERMSIERTGKRFPKEIYPNYGMRNKIVKESTRLKHSKRSKKLWLIPKWKKRTSKAISKALKGKPKNKKVEAKRLKTVIEEGTFKGKNNPMFNNWSSREPYGKDWDKKLKEKIKTRDGFKCQLINNGHHSERLGVHHIDYNKKNCKENNLIALCIRHNSMVNGDRQYWTGYFQNMT